MVDHEATVEQFEEEELALEDVGGSIWVLLFVHVSVLLPHEVLALGDELVRAHHAALLYLGGEVDAGGTEEERVDVTEGVGGVETPVVHYGGRDDLLAELQVLAAEGLDEVGEKDVDFLELVNGLKVV